MEWVKYFPPFFSLFFINPFLASVTILKLLTIPEKKQFPGVFSRNKMVTLARSRLHTGLMRDNVIGITV